MIQLTGNGLPSDPVALEGYVVSKMADKWYQFGIHLGLSVETLRSLGDSKYIPDDPTRCLVMFRHWMKEVGPRENEMDIIQQAMKKVMKVCELELIEKQLILLVGKLTFGLCVTVL